MFTLNFILYRLELDNQPLKLAWTVSRVEKTCCLQQVLKALSQSTISLFLQLNPLIHSSKVIINLKYFRIHINDIKDNISSVKTISDKSNGLTTIFGTYDGRINYIQHN